MCSSTVTASADSPAVGLGAPTALRVEYQTDPLGIDTPAPRFAWQVNDPRRGAVQTAYQIVIVSDVLSDEPAELVWDTDKVLSDQSTNVVYAGKPLRSGTRYLWKVRTWDADDRVSEYADIRWFEMGLLSPDDWKAEWISPRSVVHPAAGLPWGDWIWAEDAAGPHCTCYLRRRFTLPADRVIAAAWMKVTADDAFELFVNGRTVGKGKSWQRVQVYDVRAELTCGENVIAIEAGNAEGNFGVNCTLRVTLDDGTQVDLRSDKTFKACGCQPNAWTTLGFKDEGWPAAMVVAEHGAQPWGALPAVGIAPRSQYVRKEFAAEAGIGRARVYATGLGLYQLHLNGQRVGNDVFTPGWTKYDDRMQYQTYDVTELVRQGENAIGAVLGNGWWSGGLGWWPTAGESQRRLQFFAQLQIDYLDGRTETIVTDDSWRSHASPMTRNTFYHGETYNARLAIPGWSRVGLDDADWTPVDKVDAPTAMLSAQRCEPIRVTAERPVGQVSEPTPGVFIYDFEQNAAGWARLTVRNAEPGTRIRLRFGEELHPDGTLFQDNYRAAEATDYYICQGGPEEVWEPTFTYRGFRYCELVGYPGHPPSDALVQCVVHTDSPMAGRFECSEWVINRVLQNTVWGQRSNMHSVPTDCPQRDERLGWMGDAQVFAPTGCWNMDWANFMAKWMRDIMDSQYREGEHAGAVTDVAPVVVITTPAKPGWGDAAVIVPWVIYRYYGDTRIIEEHYDGLVRWVEYMHRLSPELLYIVKDLYGDWVPVEQSPGEPIGTAYFFYSTKRLSQMASVLGRDDDAIRYADLAKRIAKAYNRAYFDAKTNTYQGDTQTAYLLPLAFGITPPDKREAVFKRLVENVAARGDHLTTGFLGTAYLLPTLSEHGEHDRAYRVATQMDYPSWGYMATHGATTIWERWNSDKMGSAMNSRNHFAFGVVAEWYYENLAGIQLDPHVPGFKRFVIAPQPAPGLDWVRAEYPSPYGMIRSAWRRCEGRLVLDVSIPANAAATVVVPTQGCTTPVIREGDQVIFSVFDVRLPAIVPGVGAPQASEGVVRFEVAAGTYRFTVSEK